METPGRPTVIACIGALLVSGCIIQPVARIPASPGPPLVGGVRWDHEATKGGMLGVAADNEGSTGAWSVDEGPKPRQRSLRVEYDLKPGGFVGVWRTIERLNLAHADGLRFMAKADPPGTVQLSMTDANEVSYVVVFQITSKAWTEIDVPMALFDKNPSYQKPQASLDRPVDWTRTTSMTFDACTEGRGTFWIGPVYIDD